jgi:hypothetical protein
VIKVNLVLVHYEKYTTKSIFNHFIDPLECGRAARLWLIHARGIAGICILAFLPGHVIGPGKDHASKSIPECFFKAINPSPRDPGF